MSDLWFYVRRDSEKWMVIAYGYSNAFRKAWEESGSLLPLRYWRAAAVASVATYHDLEEWKASGRALPEVAEGQKVRRRRLLKGNRREVYLSEPEKRVLRKRPHRGVIGPLSDAELKRAQRFQVLGLGIVKDQHFVLSDIGRAIREKVLPSKVSAKRGEDQKCSSTAHRSKITSKRSVFG